MSSIFYHPKEFGLIHTDDLGFIHNIFHGNCYGTIKKHNNGKFEFTFAEDSFSHFYLEADNMDDALQEVLSRIFEIYEMDFSKLNINKDFKFNYYDWTELAEYLNLDKKWTEFELDHLIWRYLFNNSKELIPVFKEFALKVTKGECNEELIKALCEIENDHTFCTNFSRLLSSIWN